jgi:hypothetical protein
LERTVGKIEIVSPDEMPLLFGQRDEYIEMIEQDFGIHHTTRQVEHQPKRILQIE